MKRALALSLLFALAPPLHAADVVRGAQLYRMHCAGCHGTNGVAPLPSAPSFARGEKLMQPDRMLVASIRSGRAAMPGYFGILNDRDMLDVVAYLRTFR